MDWPVIHSYSRAQAIKDGTLVEVPAKIAAEAGWTRHVAMTRAAWEDCVAWDDADNARKGSVQDEQGRLWDVLFLAARAVKRGPESAGRVRLSNGAEALVDQGDVARLAGKRWHYERGYAVRTEITAGRQRKIYMHAFLLPVPDGYQVDHINGNGLDNRRSNLRIATASQNQMNAGHRSDGRSDFRGVSWESQTGKWRVRMHAGGRDLSLGRFVTIDAAREAYIAAANQYFGVYAQHNRTDRIDFSLHRVPRAGRAIVPRKVILAAVAGPGDDGELAITLMQQGED